MTEFTIAQLKFRVRLLVGLIVLVVILISAWSIISERKNVINSAERLTAGYARALAEHAESAFAESDRVLRDMLVEIRWHGNIDTYDRRELFQLLRRQTAGSPQIASLFITDKKGMMFINSLQFPSKQVDVSDREYFRHFLSDPAADFYISKPVMSRLVNRWRFDLIRPLNLPGEAFAGLVAVVFEVQYFNNFYSPGTLGPHGRIELVRTDGAPLVFEPYREKAFDADFSNSALFRDKLPAAPTGTYHVDNSVIDNSPRINSYHRLSRFPVVAVVSLHKDDVLGPWARKAVLQSSMTLALCGVIVILTRLIFRHLDRLQSVHTLLEGQQEQLRIKAAQIDAANDAILQIDEEGKLVHFNYALSLMTGYTRQELTGIRLHDIEPPEFAEQIIPNLKLLHERGQATFESAYLAKDQSIIPVEVHARTMESDNRFLVLSIVRDITQRKRDELREHARLKILEEMATGTVLEDLLEYIVRFVEQESPGALCSVLLANEAGDQLLHGAAPSLPEFYNKAVNGLAIRHGMGSCGTAAFLKQRVVVEDILVHPFWNKFTPAHEAGLRACWSEPILSSDGEVLGTFAIYYQEPRLPREEEIKLIESAAHLASIAIGRERNESLRKNLEDQLLHIQKIEAIGQLAGGVAHDFNNLLTPIIVYADMLCRGFTADHPEMKKVEGILSAAHKAKDLTQKLLSFGRKQMLCMETLDINQVISSFQDILRRTIRENVEIEIKLSPSEIHVLADRGQIEQILLNLTVNAQDAIAENGKVTLETGHLILDDEYARLHPGTKPGPYILLAFSDNGCGMSDDVLRHIFEPFFTTKAIGHGTGLGLATVYGIIKQHEGYIEVKSRVGEGTTFTIYLPAQTAGASPAGITRTAKMPENRNVENLTILVVEDNDMVREMIVDLLQESGCRVLVADMPSKALQIADSCEIGLDLLITDMVMPEMNGTELYERLSEKRPKLPVLYISGYTHDMVVHQGTLSEEVNFLKKPFTSEQFLQRIQQTLGEPS